MKVGEELYDGFEGKELSPIWSHKKFIEGAVKLQSNIVRKGKKAVEITIHSGDRFEDNKGKSKNSERDEIREQENLWANEEEAYSYSISMFVPENFPIVPTRLVLMQWKHYDENGDVLVDNPIIALRYQMGELRITIQTTEEKVTLFKTLDEIKGKWIDFKFNIKFTREDSGFLKVWMNKKKVVDYKGPTAYPEKYKYPYPGRFHFRFGPYRDLMQEPMTVYYDEFKKKRVK